MTFWKDLMNYKIVTLFRLSLEKFRPCVFIICDWDNFPIQSFLTKVCMETIESASLP